MVFFPLIPLTIDNWLSFIMYQNQHVYIQGKVD